MTDLAEVKTVLEARLRELNDRAEDIDDELRKPGDDDWQEGAAEAAEDEVLEGVGVLANKEIQQIKAALARIEAGKYGTCNACGNAIKAGRLKALPFASTCVECA